MPYKDKQKQKEYKIRWNKQYYKKNKDKELKRTRKRKKEVREWFNEYKTNLNCSKCGENHIACLEFHHPDENKKSFEISAIIQKGYSRLKILSEVEKCIVLCANCHRKLHYQ